jgi:putative DNA-invertase from lambdoid prophage Rac
VFTILSAVAEAERDRTRERIAEVKRDQRSRGRYLVGVVLFGYALGESGELVAEPGQQKAIARMRRLREQGLAFRAIGARMKASGVSISHMAVKNALGAAERRTAA